MLSEIGGLLLALFGVVAFGNLWFYGVEALLNRIRRLIFRRKPAPWHPLPGEKEDG